MTHCSVENAVTEDHENSRAVMICQECGKEIRDGQKFCKYCGSRLSEPVICISCGKENKQGQKFCKYCGSALISADTSLTPSDEDHGFYNTEVTAGDEVEELLYEEPYRKRTVKSASKKSTAPKRKRRGIYVDKRVLIGVIVSLGVAVFILGLCLVAYISTGTFNPVSLFERKKAEEVAESDRDAVESTDKPSGVPPKTADIIEVTGIEDKAGAAEEETTAADPFTEFLAGKTKATVADDYLSAIEWTTEMKPGQEYSFSDLEDYVLKDEGSSLEFYGFEKPTASYAVLNTHGGVMNALKLSYRIKGNDYGEGLDETYVFYDNNGKLEIKFAIDESNFGTGPTIRGGSVNAEGVSNYYAHDGAGEVQYSRLYAPDSNFSYKIISNEESHFASEPNFNEMGSDTPIEPLNMTMQEAASQNEAAGYVIYSMEKINEDVYFYYLGDGEEGLSQNTVDFIDAIAATHGFGFDGKATADAARDAYEKELGVFEACRNDTSPQWIDVK